MTSANLRLGVAFDLAIPMPFSGWSIPSLCRLSNVVILAFRPRLPTPRWRHQGVRVFPVVKVILLPQPSEGSRASMTVGGEFPIRALSVARRGPSSTIIHWPPVLPVATAARLSRRCGSVVRVLSSTQLPGFTGPESSVLPVNLPSSVPFPFRVRRYRGRFSTVSSDRETGGLPGVRHTPSPYPVPLQCTAATTLGYRGSLC